MASAFGGPGKYIQQNGLLKDIGRHVREIGRRALIVLDRAVESDLRPVIERALTEEDLACDWLVFSGECSQIEIDRIASAARAHRADVFFAAGGGKAADAVKFAAHAVGARIVIIPTIASTDAPCSAIGVRYTPAGVFEASIKLARNPDLVLVDTDVITRAPVRFLVAGIGDALSTWFEARSNLESRSNNYVASGFPPTRAGIAIARECHEVLMRDGYRAVIAARAGLCTQAVENIIEANILLSGLGFENVGCAAAHGIHDGLTVLDETHHLYHGEKVAFGTLCLLMLENRPADEILAMLAFCRSVGLPTTLADLGLETPTRATIERVAAAALAPGQCTFATPVNLTVPRVTDAMLALDALARDRNAAVTA